VTLVTGFLGAGKTTLINRMLREADGLRLAILVNDYGAVSIDAELIAGASEEIVSLKNGCVCCSLTGGLQAAISGVLRCGASRALSRAENGDLGPARPVHRSGPLPLTASTAGRRVRRSPDAP
jgi:hypothetical protein